MSSSDTVTEHRYVITIQYRPPHPRDLRKPRRDSSIQTRVLIWAVVVRYGEGLLQRPLVRVGVSGRVTVRFSNCSVRLVTIAAPRFNGHESVRSMVDGG